MRGVYFFLLLSIFILKSGFTQNIDSLKYVLQSQPDSLKLKTLIELGIATVSSEIDASLKYSNEARALAKKLNKPEALAIAIKYIGQGLQNQGNYPEAIIQFQASLQIFDSLKNQTGVANILSNLGVTYSRTGDDTKAIDFYLQSLKVSESIQDFFRIATVYNNIGGIYFNQGSLNQALTYFQKALPLFKMEKYEMGIAYVAMNIGEIYKDQQKYDSAIYYLDTSLGVLHNSLDATFPLTLLGEIYAERGNFDEALLYQNRALEIAEQTSSKLEMAQSLLGIAQTHTKQKKFPAAISAYKRAADLAQDVNAKNELKSAYEGLSLAYSKIGDYKNAFNYESLHGAIKDTLYITANDKKIQQLQFAFDIGKKESEISLLTKDKALQEATIERHKTINYAVGISGFLLLIVAFTSYNRYKFAKKTNQIIKKERDKSQELLLNILPEETALELEQHGQAQTRYYENVTVLFTDFKGFSSIAGKLSPQDLVAELNEYFIAFDEIVERNNLEKIKTIGDAYMCAGGIPKPNYTHPINAVQAALEMQTFMRKKFNRRKDLGLEGWELRIGIHTGPIVAGVVGKKKYAYDIWGDTVNIASRMESGGEPWRVNISSATYLAVKDKFPCHYRGKISAKNIGDVDMYFIESDISVNQILMPS